MVDHDGPAEDPSDAVDADPGEPGAAATVPDDAEIRDSLPADLDVGALAGPYLFPNNSRRRIPGVLYVLIGVAAIAVTLAAGDDAVLTDPAVVLGGGALVLVGLYHLQAGWDLAIDERDALVAATRDVGFPVGHASAQLGWRGLRSRPTWRVLVYSNEAPPRWRGLVLVDGVDGHVVDRYVEENPEDWTGLAH